MVKTEELDYDVFSDDGLLWKEIGASSANQSTCLISAKEVKLEDDNDDSDSFGDVFVHGNSAPTNSKPISSSSSQVKQENSPSSFPHYLRSSFIAMGFASALVDKVIKENGDQDENMLLEILIRNSQSSPQSSDSWGQFSTDENTEKEEKSPIEFTTEPKQEFEDLIKPSSTGWMDMRSSLATMGFPDKDIDLAISRLGVNPSLAELVDFIVTSQTSNSSGGNEENEESVTAKLFSTMDKTLCLLQMGFTENEVSFAIETLGPEVPVGVLAESIFSKRMSFAVNKKEEDVWDDIPESSNQNQNQSHPDNPDQNIHKRSNPWTDPWPTQAPNPNPNPNPNPINTWISKDPWTTKAPNLDPNDGWIRKESTSNPFPTNNYDDDDVKAIKKSKPTNNNDKTASCSKTPYDWDWNEDTALDTKPDQHPSVKQEFPYTRNNTSSKLPYFFYANTIDVSQTTWQKLSQFLYVSAPEFTNSQFFSALCRKEGYLHNLPTENRSHLVPKPPMEIEEALPFTRKWWPSWDTRKQISCISSDTTGTAQLCERLSKMMTESQGFLTKEQQVEIMHHCKKSNLIWAGLHRLSPIEPTHIETILGYPENHTQILNLETEDRLRLLKDAIQVHTLGYHISALKNMFPDGIRVLSVFTGVGGAVIALHRLGIWLKCVVSVEERECNRKILKRWWQETEQCGELRQIKGINRLTSRTLESYMDLFGGFDVVIGCNPGDGNGKEMNFSLFYEFVRVFQRVRSMMGRNNLS